MPPLNEQHCHPLVPGTKPLAKAAVSSQLSKLEGWKLDPTATALVRKFEFADFPLAVHFVNQVAAIAERENHHPDIEIRWNKVELTLSSHDVGGISDNDLILAAQIDQIV